MATPDATGSVRKKLTTYGKTSRKSSKPVFSLSASSDRTQVVAVPLEEVPQRSTTTAVAREATKDNDKAARPLRGSQRADASLSSITQHDASQKLPGAAVKPGNKKRASPDTYGVLTQAPTSNATRRSPGVPMKDPPASERLLQAERTQAASINRKVRLIDRLVAQAIDSAELDSEQANQPSDSLEGYTGQALVASESNSTTPRKSQDDVPRLGAQRATPDSRKRKARVTYGQQRTMRTAVDVMQEGAGTANRPHEGSYDRNSPPPAKFAKMDPFSLYDDPSDDDVRPSKNGILSLHALRQAGANHRFADELSDLAERIGSPKSLQPASTRSRRTAILELGAKLQDDKFVGRLCDYGPKETFFQDLEAEEDIINAFVILSSALILMASLSAPHLIDHLLSSGVTRILSTMLALDDDIMEIARQKAANLSKRGLASMGMLRGTILQLGVWDGSPPAVLSPKTLALKVLCFCHKSSDAEARLHLVEPVVPRLFALISKNDGDLSLATVDDRIQVNMALLLLQEHSVVAMESKMSQRWTTEYLPTVALFLSGLLTSPGDDFRESRYLTLKLAMNTTNNNPISASIFGQGRLIRQLATASLSRFHKLHAIVGRGEFPTDVHRTLVLLLGLLINIAEHCPESRQSLAAEIDLRPSSLDGLVTVWLENRELCGKAETVEQTSLAVAYGYLAILLGYLCLEARVRQRLTSQSNKKGLSYLLDSVQEFMTLHARAAGDDLAATLQPLVNELRLMMKRS
ncbi:uncharacterized protein VDAG_08298 [Verticillium dahliae VdLs.17]|uniref:Wings apart-like protein C-terminal domain-containing protein n=1 Tax=Verticillium dahliae (strain VdLs.17 / ATCC MYA-4575 / FGSC 10137) TaxID=498257 RepID=G2XDR6_VERDV|nr:uncharacterized protein VDAG_08298 [Verticillium dahliae VdLs.17]EGY17964.1 hypothetical protein VDAG_08298 [Verticillium dahliae VdLs.17]KAH6698701.1 hypothetical protein EV126DRAFT_443418 [Verticillium dahliae]